MAAAPLFLSLAPQLVFPTPLIIIVIIIPIIILIGHPHHPDVLGDFLAAFGLVVNGVLFFWGHEVARYTHTGTSARGPAHETYTHVITYTGYTIA